MCLAKVPQRFNLYNNDGTITDKNETYRNTILAIYGVGELNYLNYLPAIQDKLAKVIIDSLFFRVVKAFRLDKHLDDSCYQSWQNV